MNNDFQSFFTFYDIANSEQYYFGLVQDSIQGLTPTLFHNDFILINKLLLSKFKHWTMRYFIILPPTEETDSYTKDEFDRIFRDSYINFYWLNKKNMIEKLDEFGNMNMWGAQEISKMSQLVIENYIPLSSDVATPHSESPMTSNANKQYIDFLKYYNAMSSTSNRFYDNYYGEYLPIFKTIYN